MIYSIKKKQFVPIPLEEAWGFFSDPSNLATITPDDMGFKITNDLQGRKMYAGQIITYTVKPLLGIPLTWVTEITQVVKNKHFIDEQRVGPYAMWHHSHFFEEVEGGTMCTDEVYYQLPLGFLGDMMHGIMVKPQLDKIFQYREDKLKELFG